MTLRLDLAQATLRRGRAGQARSSRDRVRRPAARMKVVEKAHAKYLAAEAAAAVLFRRAPR